MDSTQKYEDFFGGTVYAVLIGIDKYENGIDLKEGETLVGTDKFANLKYCVNDVSHFKKFLNDHFVPDENIKFLISEHENTTREDIIKAFSDVAKNVKHIKDEQLSQGGHDPLVIVFWSGHGIYDEDEKDGYLLPFKANKSNISGTGISHSDFNKYLNKIETSKMVVFLDSCHSGAAVGNGVRGDPNYDPIQNIGLGEGKGFYLFTSCSAQQTSKEEDGRGVFTKELMKILENPYQIINAERVTPTNLWEPLVRNVKNATNDNQIPFNRFIGQGEGITLALNIKFIEEEEARRKLEDDRRKIKYEKQKKFLERIKAIIKDEETKDCEPIIGEIELYIEKNEFQKDYESFYKMFERYAENYIDTENEESVKIHCHSLLLNRRTLLNKQEQKNSFISNTEIQSKGQSDSQVSVSSNDSIERTSDNLTLKEKIYKEKKASEENSLRLFSDSQRDKILEELDKQPKFCSELVIIDRILRSNISKQSFMQKMRKILKEFEVKNPDDYNEFEETWKLVVEEFSCQWPNAEISKSKSVSELMTSNL